MKPIVFEKIIVFENDNYIVVNKPPFISTLDDRAASQSLLELAIGYCNEAQACHRLDKETSGALVFAKNKEAYKHMAMQFEARKVGKVYHAVVHGTHDFNQHEIFLPLSASAKGIAKIEREGKEAYTVVSTIKAYRNYTLVQCMPLTGRLHQIRIHMASQDAPIVCDPQYGGEMLYLSQFKRNFNLKKGTEERPIMNRVALHAKGIGFEDLDGTVIKVDTECPKDFSVLLKQLDKFA